MCGGNAGPVMDALEPCSAARGQCATRWSRTTRSRRYGGGPPRPTPRAPPGRAAGARPARSPATPGHLLALGARGRLGHRGLLRRPYGHRRAVPCLRAPPASSAGHGWITRVSVTIAVTRWCGVTSKAGLTAAAPSGAARSPPNAEHLGRRPGPRSGRRPRCGVDVHSGLRRHHEERDAGRPRAQRVRVAAHLVHHVKVRADPVGPQDHRVDLTPRHQERPGAVDRHPVRDAEPAQLPRGQPGALQQRPGLAGDHAAEPPAPVQLGRRGPARCRRSPWPARRCCSGSAAAATVRTGSVTRSAPAAAPSPRWPRSRRRAGPAPPPARPSGPSGRAAAARRTPRARLTAVGRAVSSAAYRRRPARPDRTGAAGRPGPPRAPRPPRSRGRPAPPAVRSRPRLRPQWTGAATARAPAARSGR